MRRSRRSQRCTKWSSAGEGKPAGMRKPSRLMFTTKVLTRTGRERSRRSGRMVNTVVLYSVLRALESKPFMGGTKNENPLCQRFQRTSWHASHNSLCLNTPQSFHGPKKEFAKASQQYCKKQPCPDFAAHQRVDCRCRLGCIPSVQLRLFIDSRPGTGTGRRFQKARHPCRDAICWLPPFFRRGHGPCSAGCASVA